MRNEKLIIAIDLETTGLVPGFNEIIDIAMVKLDEDFKPSGERFHEFLKIRHPERYSEKAKEVNGLTVEEINARGKEPEQVQEEAIKWLSSICNYKLAIPMGHNYKFDRGFLETFFGESSNNIQLYYIYFNKRYIDTMDISITVNRKYNIFTNVKLGTVCEVLNVVNDNAHTAMSDVLATVECHKVLLEKYSGG